MTAINTVSKHNKKSPVPRIIFLLISAVLIYSSVLYISLAEKVKPTAIEQIISKIVAVMISRHHYAGHELDTDLSKQLFVDFFDRLDHNRSFFLASDIEEFRSYEMVLSDLLLKGNVDFAYAVYERFKQRVRERVDYVNDRLQQPFDFNLDETIMYDRSEEPWCTSVEELNEVWRKRIKNNLLVYSLMEEAGSASETQQDNVPETEVAPEEDSGKEGKDVTEPEGSSLAKHSLLPPRKTPEERVKQFYDRYLKQIEANQSIDVLEIFLTVFARLYDPHSSYMAPDTEEDFDIAMRLSLQGIGALLTTEDSLVRVEEVIPGGPAEQDGRLKKGDLIIAVAQEGEEPVDIIDMPLRKVVNMIRGQKGSTVYLTVVEAGKGLGSVPKIIDIVRDEVKLTEQEAKVNYLDLPFADEGDTEPQVAVIGLPSFYADFQGKNSGKNDYKSSARDVRRLLNDAKQKKAKGVILDLRSNGGGSLEEAIEMAGLFFKEGPVVQVRKSNGEVEKRYDPDKTTVYSGPLVVLVDRFSASASEIVAAAIQDYGRGVIVGEKSTHGKGTVQTIYHLNDRLKRSPIFRNHDAGSIKFTMAKFYRITGGSTQVKGVNADIALPSFTDYMELGEEHLPHVLPWDSIEPLEFDEFNKVTPFVPILAERSEQRQAADAEFQEYLSNIRTHKERQEQKSLTLNKSSRIKLQKEEEKWSEKVQSMKNWQKPEDKVEEEEEAADDDDVDAEKDLVLTEALYVIADLIKLQNNKMLSPIEPTKVAHQNAGSLHGEDE